MAERQDSPDKRKVLEVISMDRDAVDRDRHAQNLFGLMENMARNGNGRTDPVRMIQSYLGDRWSSLIMHLLHGGALRFGELRRLIQLLAAESTISHQVLGQKLRALQRDGFVSRRLIKDPSAGVEYELTEIGQGAYAHFWALVRWSQETTAAIRAARLAYDAAHPEADEAAPEDA